MRCNDCNKFVGVNAGDPDTEELRIDDGEKLLGTINMTGNCDACSTELLAYACDVEVLLTAEQKDMIKGHCCDLECEPDLAAETTTITRKRFSDTLKDKEGNKKELKPEELDGISVTGTVAVKCGGKGDELFTLDISEEIALQEMDEQ